jgi:pimeloyl-ACP methyl ester carboxylesterase
VCIHGGGCNSHYFEIASSSFVEEAAARGFTLLLVDRPGHGGNLELPGPRPICASVDVIRSFIDDVRRGQAIEAAPIALVGHSIGGAVAMMLGAKARDWPIASIAVAGIGDEPFPQMVNTSFPPGGTKAQPPEVLTEALFFAGGHPLSWKAIASLRAAAEPWLTAEVEEIVTLWPEEWPHVAAGIRVPVHLRLAEHERVWKSGSEVIDRMARALAGAAMVDARLLPGGGHLYEVSRRGPELIRSQVEFLEAMFRKSADDQSAHITSTTRI